jgi:hypothetical protein
MCGESEFLEVTLTNVPPHGAKHSRDAARLKALRPLRGAPNAALTQPLPPARFLRHVGNVQVWLSARPQSPRPRFGPPRSRSTPTWGVFSGSGV